MLKKFMTTAMTAVALMSASAHAAPAQSLSLTHGIAQARAATAAEDGNALAGLQGPGLVAVLIGTVLAVWGIVELAEDDRPDSP